MLNKCGVRGGLGDRGLDPGSGARRGWGPWVNTKVVQSPWTEPRRPGWSLRKAPGHPSPSPTSTAHVRAGLGVERGRKEVRGQRKHALCLARSPSQLPALLGEPGTRGAKGSQADDQAAGGWICPHPTAHRVLCAVVNRGRGSWAVGVVRPQHWGISSESGDR